MSVPSFLGKNIVSNVGDFTRYFAANFKVMATILIFYKAMFAILDNLSIFSPTLINPTITVIPYNQLRNEVH